MTVARQKMGRQAEELVAARLGAAGWRLLARNSREARGELDIVALEGHCLVFVEVKAGRAGALAGPERPVLAVGPAKQRRLRTLARSWLARASPPPHSELRFDVVGVSFDRDDEVAAIEHIRGAF